MSRRHPYLWVRHHYFSGRTQALLIDGQQTATMICEDLSRGMLEELKAAHPTLDVRVDFGAWRNPA